MAKNKQPAPAKKPAAKPVPAKKAPAPEAKKPAVAGKKLSAADLKRKILERKAAKPIAFSLDEVRAIAKTNTKDTPVTSTATAKAKAGAAATKAADIKPHKVAHIKAASLADILGFNPNKGKKPLEVAEDEIPEKYKRYYKLLIELRDHVLGALDQHTEETLKRSSKEDSGDLSSYGQHMADAGTDTFDRDFALSVVSSEQEALSEIEAAIKRIRDNTYGICEITGKPIAKERLLAVPFTRYSTEAQKEMERNNHRSVQRGGIFGDGTGEEGGKMMEEDSSDE
ncbi:MAG TPA: TraR/DksA C4-type zinc finger protein [Opitutaceae bacterium]|nr:TraR/DksA C4-type zinc finger protein [Opitutaceae bacterium]